MKYLKIKEFLRHTPDAELIADFLLLVTWGVIIGSIIAFSVMLLTALLQ